MRIPMVFEPTFARDSIWCTEIKRGMTRVMHVQKYEALLIPGEHYRTYDYEALFAPGGARLLILCGTSPSWLRPALLFFRERGIGVLIVDGYPNAAPYVAGQVTFDYRAGMAQALACLRARGCRGAGRRLLP